MGIKSLTQTIKKYAPNAINHDNLYKLSGKKVAVDASLIIYQQLLSNRKDSFVIKKGRLQTILPVYFIKL